MSTLSICLRGAAKSDDANMARLINYAGEGLPLHYWRQIAAREAAEARGAAPHGAPFDTAQDAALESAWTIGRQRARREDGAFSYRNATVAERDGDVVGLLIDYRLPETPEPFDPTQVPPIFAPLEELEALAPGTHYVNVLAVEPAERGRGLGTCLLGAAERAADGRDLTLIVSDANAGARRLYRRLGFRDAADRPMIKDGWDGRGARWILMRRPARAASVL